MRYYKESHVNEVFNLYEKILSLPEWEFREYEKLKKKIENAKAHMRKHSKEENHV
ncbi:hypothetical protein [Bacillus anthracis]